MSIFNELKDSLTEAVDIKHARKAPSRVTRYKVVDVKTLRESLAITQAQLAQALGTSVDTITQLAWPPKCWRLFRITPSSTTNWLHTKPASTPNHCRGALLRP